MRHSPIIGNAFTINTKTFHYYDDFYKAGGGADPHTSKQLSSRAKCITTGWISVYDCVGILGVLASSVFLNVLRLNYRLMFGPKADRRSSLFPLYVCFSAGISTSVGGYFTVFGSSPNFYGSDHLRHCSCRSSGILPIPPRRR